MSIGDNTVMAEKSQWTLMIEQNPDHSHWYAQRFRDMAAAGKDLHGEARLVDAMAPRQARVFDAGCGPGRLGGELIERGHSVVGVDVDPVLVEAAQKDYPRGTWLLQDLAELDLDGADVEADFDVIVGAGNVMPFLAPSTRQTVLANLKDTLAADGRIVLGFGAGRGYSFDDFFADVADVQLSTDIALSTWELHPWTADSEFLVAVLSRLSAH